MPGGQTVHRLVHQQLQGGEIYHHEYRSFWEELTGWETYRTWYRADRLHQSLHYLSPLQYAGTVRNRVLSVA